MSLFIDKKQLIILGLLEPSSVIKGKFTHKFMGNPETNIKSSSLSRNVWFDAIDDVFIKNVFINVSHKGLITIRSNIIPTDQFKKYELSFDEALDRFLIVTNNKV